MIAAPHRFRPATAQSRFCTLAPLPILPRPFFIYQSTCAVDKKKARVSVGDPRAGFVKNLLFHIFEIGIDHVVVLLAAGLCACARPRLGTGVTGLLAVTLRSQRERSWLVWLMLLPGALILFLLLGEFLIPPFD